MQIEGSNKQILFKVTSVAESTIKFLSELLGVALELLVYKGFTYVICAKEDYTELSPKLNRLKEILNNKAVC